MPKAEWLSPPKEVFLQLQGTENWKKGHYYTFTGDSWAPYHKLLFKVLTSSSKATHNLLEIKDNAKENKASYTWYCSAFRQKLNILELVGALQSCLILEPCHRSSVIRLESKFQKTLFVLIFIKQRVSDLTGCNIKACWVIGLSGTQNC